MAAAARRVFADLIATVLPASCAGCQRLGSPLCSPCRAGLRRPISTPPPPGVDWWVAAYAYEGVAREAISRAKYRDHRAVLSWLAQQLDDACPRVDVDLVTWVPASQARRRDRGVDHAELLAARVARRRDLPVRRLLVRAPDRPQTGRTARERRLGPALRVASRAHVEGRRVLVIDDVTTTGVTAMAAARTLRAAGAGSVAFASVARTPHHRT